MLPMRLIYMTIRQIENKRDIQKNKEKVYNKNNTKNSSVIKEDIQVKTVRIFFVFDWWKGGTEIELKIKALDNWLTDLLIKECSCFL